jgi:hypothetical protein
MIVYIVMIGEQILSVHATQEAAHLRASAEASKYASLLTGDHWVVVAYEVQA